MLTAEFSFCHFFAHFFHSTKYIVKMVKIIWIIGFKRLLKSSDSEQCTRNICIIDIMIRGHRVRMFDNVRYFFNIEMFDVRMFADIQMFESSNVRMFAYMFDVRMFANSRVRTFAEYERKFEHWTFLLNVRWPLALVISWSF